MLYMTGMSGWSGSVWTELSTTRPILYPPPRTAGPRQVGPAGPLLTDLLRASIQHTEAVGQRAGQRVRRVPADPAQGVRDGRRGAGIFAIDADGALAGTYSIPPPGADAVSVAPSGKSADAGGAAGTRVAAAALSTVPSSTAA
jgi:hypothetical protein